jgi:taurine dioxygenase
MSSPSKTGVAQSPMISQPMQVIADVRTSDADNHAAQIDSIRKQDADLIPGDFGTVYYKPESVCGVDLKLEPLQPSIGTVVHGIDLADAIETPNMIAYLRALWLDRRVIMFRDQAHLTRQQMVRFAECFGEVGAHHGERDHIPNSQTDMPLTAPGFPDMLVLKSGEKVAGAASSWHSDATWSKRPPMGSILMCREAPPIGGDTSFCDAYAMWAGLSAGTQAKVASLSAVHIGSPFHQMDGVTPSAVHTVARTHPETGRTVLFVQRGFVREFASGHGLTDTESQSLMEELLVQQGRPEYTCRFRWAAGSIAMWDNRAVLHRATADFWPHRRVMERLTMLDYDEARRTPFYHS